MLRTGFSWQGPTHGEPCTMVQICLVHRVTGGHQALHSTLLDVHLRRQPGRAVKLLFFIHSLGGGGAERVTATLANYWAAKGWDVILVTLASTHDDRYQLHPAIRRIALDRARASAGPVRALLANGRRILALRRVLRRERPDVALAMMTVANVLLSFASTGLGLVRIGSERTYPLHKPLGSAWERLRSWSYGWLSAVVAPTVEIRQWLLKHTHARRVEMIPNPIAWPLSAQPPASSPSAVGRPSRRRLLAVGRLGVEKRHSALIDVFAGLMVRFPNWELVIAGEGPEHGRLQAQIELLGLGDSVFLPGHLGNIGDWYQSADLYVLTSDREGFPNTLVEALAYGVPAVSVDCDTGPRDILRPDVDGLLVPAGDDAALTTALGRLMGDAATLQAFAMRASEARTRFSLEVVCTAWERLLKELLG